MMSGRLIRLRGLLPSDYEVLYQITVSEELSYRWRHLGGIPSIEKFVQSLHENVLCQFTVVSRAADQPLGYVVGYAPDFHNGFAFMAVAMSSRMARSGAGIEAAALLTCYLFDTWALRKIYFEASGFVYPAYSSGEGRLFALEGVLKDHTYYRGEYWDEYMLAIYREQLDEIRARLGGAIRHDPDP